MKNELLTELMAIVGKGNASCAIEDRVCHGYDATKGRALPDVVVKPANAEEVSRILLLANRKLIPVYPRGAGSGITGGSLPLKGGIVVDSARMDRILSIDNTNGTATVEAGVVLSDLQSAVERKGLFYPPDPASKEFCTIGGNLAECAGGLRCVKYGVTRDYVLSAEAVLPTGEIIHPGSRTMKSVVGYDLGRLLIGSEGTLCIFIRATLRLLPLPECVRTLMAYFTNIDDAVRAVTSVVSRGIIPRTLEIMDELTIRCIRNYKPFGIPSSAKAIVLAESDGPEASADGEAARMAEIFHVAGAAHVETPKEAAEADLLWEIRRSASAALYSLSPGKLNEDVCVPRSRMLELFAGISEISHRHGVAIACFGHAGDGNIHVNVLYDIEDESERSRADKAVEDLFRHVIALGGSITGEHGIGTAKAKFLSWEMGEREIALMRGIKRLLDPNNILNPGKIFVE
ncbi:MAG: FAD-linked oxidase C-terminal domain-containing protein [bacterium]